MEDLSPYLTAQFRGFPRGSDQTRRLARHNFLCERWGLTAGTLTRHDQAIRKSAFTIRKSVFPNPSRQWRPEERYIPRVSAPFRDSPIRAVGDYVAQDLEPRLRHNFRVLQTETNFLRDRIDHLSGVVSEMSARLGRHLDAFSERQPVQAEVVGTDSEALTNATPIASDVRKDPEQQSIQATTSETQEELAALKKARAEDQLRLEQLEVDLELARKRARLARFETERMRGDPMRNKAPNIFSSNLPTSGSQKRVPVGTILQTARQNPTTTQRVSEPKSSSRPLIRSAFLKLRQAVDEFSTSSGLQLGPLPPVSAGLDSSLCPPDVWNSLSAQQRSQRVMAKIFEILWDDILRPDLFSFGLEGVKLTNDSDKTVSQPEKHLRTLEKRFLELGVGTSTLHAWRRSVITTSAPLQDPILSLAPIASKIFKALSPVVQFVFARNAEKVKAQMLKICRDAMELKLLLRSEEGEWKVELHLHSGEIKGIEPGAKELEHRIALFGALTKGNEGKSQGARIVVDRAWTVLVAKPADQDQRRKPQEVARSFGNAEPAPGYIRDSFDRFTSVTRKPRLKVRDEEGAPVPVNFKPSATPPIKSLPEIARERREILAKAKAREEKARQRSPVRPSISPQRMWTSKTPGPGSTKLEVEEEKKKIASFLLGPSQQRTATPTNHVPPPAPPASQQLSFKHSRLEETTEKSVEGSTSSIRLPPRDVREDITPEQQFLKQQNITILRDGVALREGKDVMSETVQALRSTGSVKETKEPVRDQSRLEAPTSKVPSMMKKIKKRKRHTQDDKWGLRSYKPENDPRGDRDSEDSSNSSGRESQTDGGMTMTTRSSTPASGTVRSATATLDFASSSITVGRTIQGGGTSQSTATVGREELDGELLTGTASRKRRKKSGKVGGEDGLSEEGVRGNEVGSTTAVLAKVLALFDDSG